MGWCVVKCTDTFTFSFPFYSELLPFLLPVLPLFYFLPSYFHFLSSFGTPQLPVRPVLVTPLVAVLKHSISDAAHRLKNTALSVTLIELRCSKYD